MYGLDVFLILLALISGFLAMVRGVTRELLTLVAWIGAIVTAFYAVGLFRDKLTPVVGSASIASVAILGSVFIVVLLITTFIAVKVSSRLLDSKISALESSLGFVYGLARGLVVVALLYVFFSQLVPANKHPSWIAQAKMLPLIDGTGKNIVSLIPEDNFDTIMDNINFIFKPKDQNQKDNKPNKDDQNKDENDPKEAPAEEDKTTGLEGQTGPSATSTNLANDQNSGYGTNERRSLNQLMESTGSARN